MSAYEKISQGEMLDYHSTSVANDPNPYAAYYSPPYVAQPLLYSSGQDADYQYMNGNEYAPSRAMQHDVPVMNPQAHNIRPMNSYRVDEHRPIDMQSSSRKRKASSISEYDLAPPHKKAAIAQVHVQDPSGEYYDISGHTSPYSPFVPTPTGSTGYQSAQTAVSSPRNPGHHYSTSTASQVSLAAPSPHTPAWSPSFTTVKTEQSPRPPMTPVPRPVSASSPLKSSVPKLVRTSTIQQSPPPGIPTTMTTMHAQSFNPYAMYPLKANLKLQGDLDSMVKDWSSDEIDSRRRLVEFKRCQSGSTISADFKPVTPQDRAPSSITISCILWKEKKEYYVTSVDTIYLLEALVGVRFTVEEKNRIRRNLEGFRPMTVSKSKLDSEDFFKTIMGFPHPKPRNIEKDVKVFPWKILSHALKKIISKYSASYSSTASSLLTPAPSVYTSHEGPAEYYYPPSPHPEPITSIAAAYPVHTNVGYPTNQMPGRMPAPVTSAPMSDLQVQAAPYDLSVPYGPVALPNMPHVSMGMTPHAMNAPVHAPWDYTNFIHDHPVAMAPQSAPQPTYARGSIDTADFITPTHYQMQ